MRPMNSFLHDESGTTAIEYVMLASMIALLTLAGLTVLSVAAFGRFNSLAAGVGAAGG